MKSNDVVDRGTKELIIEVDRMNAVFEDIFLPLILTNASLAVSKANKSAVAFFGVHKKLETISPELARLVAEFYKSGEISVKLEFSIQSRQLLIQVSRVSSEDILVILEDVSKEYFLSEQLRQAQKMEAVGQLASGIAHDFSNLLTVIGGYAAIIKKKLDSENPNTAYLEQIYTSITKGTSMIRNLLDFTRSSTSKYIETDLNSVIVNITMIAERLLNSNVTVHLHLCMEKLFIMADEVQLEQCFLNLLTNAQDAMPLGGNISIKSAVVEAGDVEKSEYFDTEITEGIKYAKVSFSDTGTGIDEATLKKIFDPFFTTKPPQKGTGLGLAMVHEIVRHHSGIVICNSIIDEGTTFHLYFPLI